MKNLKFIYVALLALLIPFSGIAAVDVPTGHDNQEEVSSTDWLNNLSVEEFLALSPKDLKAKTGEKVKLADRVALRLTQRQLKKAQKKGESLDLSASYDDAKGNFNIGGFLLGFFLGLIGVLIALLFGKDAVRSSLIGLLCAVIVWVILIIGVF